MRSALFLAPFALIACSSADDSPSPNDTPDSGTSTATLTYHEHAEAILQNSCQSCHRAGGIAPMPLTTYAEVKKYAPLVKQKIADRSMPPWGAFATADCTPRHGISGDLGVAQSDIDTVVKWVDQGAVEGDPSKAPPPRTFADDKLASPTHNGTIAPHIVAPSDRDEHVCIPVDPNFLEDTWIDGVQITPGNTKVVHHVVMYADPTSASVTKAGSAGTYPCFGGPGVPSAFVVAGWVPGMQPTNYPAGVAMKIPKGSKLVMQMHYHPSIDSETDTTKVDLRAAKATPTWAAEVRLIGNATSAPRLQPGPNDPSGTPTFLIPADTKDHSEEMIFAIPTVMADVRLAAVTPHMHWAGREMKVNIERAAATATDPASECLISAPRYDFNWQRGYSYNAPIEALPRVGTGDKIRIRCLYDNTMDNPLVARALAEKKLTTTQDIRMGEDTLDEMCLGGFTFYSRVN
jgi:hypothetical protein